MSNTQMRKTAVDSVAASYWENYYKDSGYGKLWVREIPKRVQAELAKKKTAEKTEKSAADETVTLRPIATLILDKTVHLEGLATYGSGQVRAFVADFDHDGNIQGFDAADVR